MSSEKNQGSHKKTAPEKGEAPLDPNDLATLERGSQKERKGGASGQKLNFLLLKIITLIFVVIAMGMCSVKYIS